MNDNYQRKVKLHQCINRWRIWIRFKTAVPNDTHCSAMVSIPTSYLEEFQYEFRS